MHQHLIQPYVIRNYEITDHRITTPVTLVLISDTHESELDLDRLSHDLNTVHPDAVLICGDLIVSADIAFEHEKWLTNTIELLKTVALHYPTYVIDGNHKVRVESTVLWDGNTTKRCYDWLWNYIKGFGGHDLNNKKVDIKGIEVFGFKSDVEYYYRRYKKKITAELIEESIGKMPDKDKYSILLAHDPKNFKAYAEWGADLVLSGHEHGGLVRIGNQGIVGPDLTLFPKYSGGEYRIKRNDGRQSRMIVSCGLGIGHSAKVRINNPTELVVVKLMPE